MTAVVYIQLYVDRALMHSSAHQTANKLTQETTQSINTEDY